MSWYSKNIFPILNNFASRPFVNHRKKVLNSAFGEIIEIGFGSGLSIPCYPPTVTRVVGVEPNEGMSKQNPKLPDRFERVEAFAENLPFGDESFDGAVSFLTLCSVDDLVRSIQEIDRVLKPGGKFFLIEHASQEKKNLTYRLQQKLEGVWKKLACGCHLTRDILGEVANVGFSLIEKKSIVYEGFPNIVSPIYRVIFEKPAEKDLSQE